MGRAREPHLNLPDDVTTPRRTPGQWEAGTGRGGARRNGAGAPGDSRRSRVATAGEGSASGGRGRHRHLPHGAEPSLGGGGEACGAVPRRGSRSRSRSRLPVAHTSSCGGRLGGRDGGGPGERPRLCAPAAAAPAASAAVGPGRGPGCPRRRRPPEQGAAGARSAAAAPARGRAGPRAAAGRGEPGGLGRARLRVPGSRPPGAPPSARGCGRGRGGEGRGAGPGSRWVGDGGALFRGQARPRPAGEGGGGTEPAEIPWLGGRGCC